jgi:hypothetical protein
VVVPLAISEGFTLSLLTAVLLRIALQVVIASKNEVIKRLRAATSPHVKVAAVLLLWVVAAGSKLVGLELAGLIFGAAVSRGGFIP